MLFGLLGVGELNIYDDDASSSEAAPDRPSGKIAQIGRVGLH
jgi:hypothetical protein